MDVINQNFNIVLVQKHKICCTQNNVRINFNICKLNLHLNTELIKNVLTEYLISINLTHVNALFNECPINIFINASAKLISIFQHVHYN
jgi:hypothetical protein